MYEFFYDESFHDRRITIKNDKLNIHDSSKSDSYIGSFIGYKSSDKTNIVTEFQTFENKYKQIFGLNIDNELKGITINSKNYEYGIANFNKNALSMYTDLFDILLKSPVFVQVIIESKTEYVLKQFLDGWILCNMELFVSLNLSIPTFKYILVKYLFHHRFPEIIKELVNENGEVNSKIVQFKLIEILEYSLSITSKYERTSEQNKAIYNVLEIIKKLNITNELIKCDYGWDYALIFNGFNRYLAAEGIERNNVSLTMDREKRTYKTAKIQGYRYVVEAESTENLCVRFSDMISNFYGRLIYRLLIELREPDVSSKESLKKNDYKSKRHISPEWFELNEKQFKLYKLISDLFMKSKKNYWCFHGGIFFDSTMIVIGLIFYIGQDYSSYEEYQRLSPIDHSKKCTDRILGGLENQWIKLRTSMF